MNLTTNGVSRRTLIAGLTGTGALLATAGPATASTVRTAIADSGLGPAAIDPAITGLTYATIDATAFFLAVGDGRYSDDTSGTGVVSSGGGELLAPLSLPTGSVIRQVNVSYQGIPGFRIVARPMDTPQTPANALVANLAAGGGPKTQTLNGNVTIAANTTYSIRITCQPGDSVYGVTVGYQPPTQGFVPFSGSEPRVYDTREAGGKFAVGEERTIELGAAGVRGAVLNVTLTETEGSGGFAAVFPAGITWPGNSSVNWSAADQNVANTVISAVDTQGRVIVRVGAARTHVVIDRIGWLL